jgi:hypothetical protein
MIPEQPDRLALLPDKGDGKMRIWFRNGTKQLILRQKESKVEHDDAAR